MALAERLATTPARRAGKPCSVGQLHDSLPPEEQAALATMLGEPSWSAGRIYDALAAEGYDVGRQTVGRHRAKACRCFKDAG